MMDFSVCWTDWRSALRHSIKDSHTYYQDESVQLMMNSLEDFLNKRVCDSSAEAALLEAMWTAAAPSERETLATLLLKIVDRI